MGNKFVRYIFILFPSVSMQLISEKMLYWMRRKTFSKLENKVDFNDYSKLLQILKESIPYA